MLYQGIEIEDLKLSDEEVAKVIEMDRRQSELRQGGMTMQGGFYCSGIGGLSVKERIKAMRSARIRSPREAAELMGQVIDSKEIWATYGKPKVIAGGKKRSEKTRVGPWADRKMRKVRSARSR